MEEKFTSAVAECPVHRRRQTEKFVGGIRSIDAGMSSVKFGSMTRVIESSKVLSRGYSTAYKAVPKTKVKTERLMGMFNDDFSNIAAIGYQQGAAVKRARKSIIF